MSDLPDLPFDPRVGRLVFFFSMGLLLYELCLTRVLSVFFYYHTAFLAVSLAMLGVGAGGVWVYIFARRFRRGIAGWMFAGAASISALPFVFAWLRFDHKLMDSLWKGKFLGIFALVSVACLLPFLIGGVVWAWWFQAYRKRAAALYGWDLLGAALGALLLVPVMEWLGGPAALLACGALLFLCTSSYAWLRMRQTLAALALAAAVATLVMLGVQLRHDPLAIQIDYAPGKGKVTQVLYKKWNAFSRVVLLTQQGWYRGMSDLRREHWKGKMPAEREALIDINAYAPLVAFDGDLKKVRFLGELVSNLAYHLRPKGQKVAILGPGGGKDVLGALLFDPQKIVGIEINPILVRDIMARHSKAFTGGLYQHPKVQIHLGDGRSVLQGLTGRFGVLVANSVATWAAHSSGAMNLAEQSLYTAESCGLYLDRLERRGILSVSLWDLNRHALPLRWIRTCEVAAKKRGIASLKDHVAVVGNVWDKNSWFSSILISRAPFTAKQKKKLSALIGAWGFDMLYIPGEPYCASEFIDYFDNPAAFVAKFPFNIQPSTDDQPFFLYTAHWTDALRFWKRRSWEENAAVVNLLISLFLVCGLLLLVLGGPLLWHKVRAPAGPTLRGADMLYFVAIGLGFMLVEIPLIQRLTLFLGHPTYALTVVLAGLLLYSGLGSLWAGTWSHPKAMARWPLLVAVLCALLLLLRLGLDPALAVGAGWSVLGRILFVLLLLAPFGLAMGMPLPLGMLRLGASRPTAIPWAWGINGASSVVASVGALWLASIWGFGFVMSLAIGCYGLAWLAVLRARRPEDAAA